MKTFMYDDPPPFDGSDDAAPSEYYMQKQEWFMCLDCQVTDKFVSVKLVRDPGHSNDKNEYWANVWKKKTEDDYGEPIGLMIAFPQGWKHDEVRGDDDGGGAGGGGARGGGARGGGWGSNDNGSGGWGSNNIGGSAAGGGLPDATDSDTVKGTHPADQGADGASSEHAYLQDARKLAERSRKQREPFAPSWPSYEESKEEEYHTPEASHPPQENHAPEKHQAFQPSAGDGPPKQKKGILQYMSNAYEFMVEG